MAGLAHAGVGLAAKWIAPKVPLGVLVTAAYGIDIVWGVFAVAGVEHMPGPEPAAPTPWSHGLFMAVVWSMLAGLVIAFVTRDRRNGLLIGALVFSHWVVDFISHPMTAVFPTDTGLLLFFEGSPVVGLGLWSTQLGVNIGEYGSFVAGLVVYLLTLRTLRHKNAQVAYERQ